MKINGCPYRATNNKTCSHKGLKKNRGGKRMCVFNHAHNCELFLEWIETKADKRNSQIKGLKSEIEASKN